MNKMLLILWSNIVSPRERNIASLQLVCCAVVGMWLGLLPACRTQVDPHIRNLTHTCADNEKVAKAQRIAWEYIKNSEEFKVEKNVHRTAGEFTIAGIPLENFEIDVEIDRANDVVKLIYWDRPYYEKKRPFHRLPPRGLGGFPHFFIITVDLVADAVSTVYACPE